MATSYIGQTSLPLALRNNNPGNIRPGDSWLGSQGSNAGFIVFKDLTYGLRALAIDLKNKINKDGLNTISKIVAKYAPPSDNNNDTTYIATVSKVSGFDANAPLTADVETIKKLIRGHATVESGANYQSYISDADIQTGVDMAFSITGTAKKVIEDNPGTSAGMLIGIIFVGFFLIKKK